MSNQQSSRRIAKVTVDRAKCFSHEQCCAIAPEVFSLDNEMLSTVGDMSKADDDTLIAAAMACPTQAIIIWDHDGNKIFPDTTIEW